MTNPRAPEGALDAGLALAAALDEAGISYALGGALALGIWGVPRGTLDVDVNVFTDVGNVAPVVDVLRALGIEVDLATARSASERQGQFVVTWAGMRVDLFTASIDFSWEAERTRIRDAVEGREAWFLSAESLAVFKLLFFRSKDVADLERLVAVRGPRLDAASVRRHIADMLGEDDPRVARWDDIVARHRGA
ncbi:MAG: hypothetical protein HY905_13365 [Deltaproteobacteria bacterium]|nr:hypothetical protein [Deltaproteobacteria bacterium]